MNSNLAHTIQNCERNGYLPDYECQNMASVNGTYNDSCHGYQELYNRQLSQQSQSHEYKHDPLDMSIQQGHSYQRQQSGYVGLPWQQDNQYSQYPNCHQGQAPVSGQECSPSDVKIKQEVDPTMSLWAKTQELSNESLKQIQNVYNTQFPMEVRHFFANWIEEQPWKEIEENNPTHQDCAVQLLEGLLNLMERRTGDNNIGFLDRLKLENIAKQFREWYSDNPMTLVRIVKQCLATEEDLVQREMFKSDSMEQQAHGTDQQVHEEIRKTIETLEVQTSNTEQYLRRMQQDQERFVINYQKNQKLAATLQQLAQSPRDPSTVEVEKSLKADKEEMDKQLMMSAQMLLQQRTELTDKHKQILDLLKILQNKVVEDELIKWKRRQQLAGNGAQFDHTLIDTIQSWCEALADLIWRIRRQVDQVARLRNQLPIPSDNPTDFNNVVTGLLSSLVTSTFIVEHQPPQVMKKDARFTATVRMLVGGKLNLQMNPPRVKATIISESQARSLLQNEDNRRNQKCGEILNNDLPMDYHKHSGQLSICFRNMSLRNIKRADRRGTDVHCVAEEKFCILFSSDFSVGGKELNFQVWTLSLPVVVTVHGNQECQATATYLWDNQFSEQGRPPFVVPDTVPWRDCAQMLSTKFQSMTGRGLTENNLKYLAHKLLGHQANADMNQLTVSWTQFNKENLPGRNFTFWEWFWNIGKLVKEHLRGPWNDGVVNGFIDKAESQDLLMARCHGTFLLRFSDGYLGGVTIAWVEEKEMVGRQVWNLHPFTIKDFSIRGLADRVKDLKTLIYLYPDIPKDKAFQKYYTPVQEFNPQAQPGAYVKTKLITIIDQPNAGVMSLDDPQSPQSYAEPFSPSNSQPRADMIVDAIMQEGEFNAASPGELDFQGLSEFLNHAT